DNITLFLRGCEELGLKGTQLFDPSDLQDTSIRANIKGSDCCRKLKNVLITIYWLGKAANSCASYSGPTLNLKEFEGLLSQMRKEAEDLESPKRSIRDSGYIDCWDSERSDSLSPPQHGRDDSFDSLDSFGSRSQQTPSPDVVIRGSSDGRGSDSESDVPHRKMPDTRKDDMLARRTSCNEPRSAMPFNQYLPNKSNHSAYVPTPLRKKAAEGEEFRKSWSTATSPIGGERPFSHPETIEEENCEDDGRAPCKRRAGPEDDPRAVASRVDNVQCEEIGQSQSQTDGPKKSLQHKWEGKDEEEVKRLQRLEKAGIRVLPASVRYSSPKPASEESQPAPRDIILRRENDFLKSQQEREFDSEEEEQRLPDIEKDDLASRKARMNQLKPKVPHNQFLPMPCSKSEEKWENIKKATHRFTSSSLDRQLQGVTSESQTQVQSPGPSEILTRRENPFLKPLQNDSEEEEQGGQVTVPNVQRDDLAKRRAQGGPAPYRETQPFVKASITQSDLEKWEKLKLSTDTSESQAQAQVQSPGPSEILTRRENPFLKPLQNDSEEEEQGGQVTVPNVQRDDLAKRRAQGGPAPYRETQPFVKASITQSDLEKWERLKLSTDTSEETSTPLCQACMDKGLPAIEAETAALDDLASRKSRANRKALGSKQRFVHFGPVTEIDQKCWEKLSIARAESESEPTGYGSHSEAEASRCLVSAASSSIQHIEQVASEPQQSFIAKYCPGSFSFVQAVCTPTRQEGAQWPAETQEDSEEGGEEERQPNPEKDDMLARRTGAFQKTSSSPTYNKFLPMPASLLPKKEGTKGTIKEEMTKQSVRWRNVSPAALQSALHPSPAQRSSPSPSQREVAASSPHGSVPRKSHASGNREALGSRFPEARLPDGDKVCSIPYGSGLLLTGGYIPLCESQAQAQVQSPGPSEILTRRENPFLKPLQNDSEEEEQGGQVTVPNVQRDDLAKRRAQGGPSPYRETQPFVKASITQSDLEKWERLKLSTDTSEETSTPLCQACMDKGLPAIEAETAALDDLASRKSRANRKALGSKQRFVHFGPVTEIDQKCWEKLSIARAESESEPTGYGSHSEAEASRCLVSAASSSIQHIEQVASEPQQSFIAKYCPGSFSFVQAVCTPTRQEGAQWPAETQEDSEEGGEEERQPNPEKDDMLARRTGAFQKTSSSPTYNKFLPMPASLLPKKEGTKGTIKEEMTKQRSMSMIDMRCEEEAILQPHSKARHEHLHDLHNRLREEEDKWQDDLARWKNRRRSVSQDLIKKEEERKKVERLLSGDRDLSERRKSIKTYREIVEEKERREKELHEAYKNARSPEEAETILRRYTQRFTVSEAVLEGLEMPKFLQRSLSVDSDTPLSPTKEASNPMKYLRQQSLPAPKFTATVEATISVVPQPQVSPPQTSPTRTVSTKAVPILSPKPYSQPKNSQPGLRSFTVDGMVRVNGETFSGAEAEKESTPVKIPPTKSQGIESTARANTAPVKSHASPFKSQENTEVNTSPAKNHLESRVDASPVRSPEQPGPDNSPVNSQKDTCGMDSAPEKYQREQEKLKQEWERAQKEVEEEERRYHEEERKILEETVAPLTPRSSTLSSPSRSDQPLLSLDPEGPIVMSLADWERKQELLEKQAVSKKQTLKVAAHQMWAS
ncbi:UNVERIFIED_CONTAM: hypothetical protein FKN15_049390, partial [Acipenser sinensis]